MMSASNHTYNICYFFKRSFRKTEMEPPADVKDLFGRYSKNGEMDVDNLLRFLNKEQGEVGATREDARDAMDEQLDLLKINDRKCLYEDEFFRYLFSDSNNPLPVKDPPKDMNSPLSHYFMYTGHNSYLTGNQIYSTCSVKPIIEALKRGVRVIELDLWPNWTKTNIHVKHGGTLTWPVKLIKCLRAIERHAFDDVSHYPVIVTLEDHLTPNLQDEVAVMLTDVFGSKLVRDASDCLESTLRSPESLKNKIIISTKLPKPNLEKGGGGSMKVQGCCFMQSDKELEDSCVWGKEIQDVGVVTLDQESQILNASQPYKDLIGIRAYKMKDGIIQWLSSCTDEHVHRVSLNEEKLESTVKTHAKEIVRFNQKNVMRVYPKGTRIDSSNFNPLVGWKHGVQMVAFNMQGHERPLWLMQGLFRANGGCGYVKKPDFLINPEAHREIFDPNTKLPVKQTLKVKVYMGEGWDLDFHRTHFDFYSPPDFYVKIGIAGVVPSDSCMKKTEVIQDKWIPKWGEEFEFPLQVPDLALLRIEVHESDRGKDDFGGQTCLPVWELKTGIRAVPLFDIKGNKYKHVKLLMRFDFV